MNLTDTKDDIIDSTYVTNCRKRRSKICFKSRNSTDDSKSDFDIICSQGKLQEIKDTKAAARKLKNAESKKAIQWNSTHWKRRTGYVINLIFYLFHSFHIYMVSFNMVKMYMYVNFFNYSYCRVEEEWKNIKLEEEKEK